MTFKYNDILISEVSYVSVVKKSYKNSICSFCFKQNKKLFKCTQCNWNSYCDRECQQKDWKQHKLECKVFAVNKTYPSDICLLILRIICKNKDGNEFTPCGIISNNYGFKPRCFDDLVSNLHNEQSKFLTEFGIIMSELEQFLEHINLNVYEFVSRDKVKIVFAKSLTNNFEIHDENSSSIGYGCYLNGSGLNHSCWPNAIYNFIGKKLILRALKNIEKTDQVYINYIDPLQLRKDRQAHLQQQYLFRCQCEACSNDELEKVMSELPCSREECKGFVILMSGSKDYKCDKCGAIETGPEMDMRHSINKAKLFHINNLMINADYHRAYELSIRELNDFHLDYSRENSGGLYQLCFGEKAFESAIFLQDYGAAFSACRSKSGCSSWIYESLVKFLGTENHPIARDHLEKFKKLKDYCI